MNRRGFLSGLGALVGGVLLGEAIPFNRVWSFPSKIIIPKDISWDGSIYESYGIYKLGFPIAPRSLDEISRITRELMSVQLERAGINTDFSRGVFGPTVPLDEVNIS